jgi:hypothetical protein
MTEHDSYACYEQQEARRKALAAQLREATKAQLFDTLLAHAVTRVTVQFDGEGDSGQIEETVAFGADSKPRTLPTGQLTIQTAKSDGSGPEQTTLRVSEVIEQLCYELLEEKYQGWEDGEGAFGEFAFNVADRTLTLTFNQRFSDFDASTHTF